MHTDHLSSLARGSLAAAMQDRAPATAPAPYVCPTCDEQACVCWLYEDAPETLREKLLRSVVLAQGKKLTEQAQAIAKLQQNVNYLLGAVKV
jgi:hypothetical protein